MSGLVPYCVGLTGGIGSGKSTVATLFAELGATVIDTDAISHALTRIDGAGYRAIVDAFAPAALNPDRSLNRAYLRALIYSDSGARKRLEAILHPLIREQVLRAVSAASGPYVVIVVPLLFETGGYADLVRRTLVVDCDEATQIARTRARSGLSDAEVRAIMASQLSRAERLAHADDVIRNEDDLASLRPRVAALHDKYLAAATPR